jgi:hypothetical protein
MSSQGRPPFRLDLARARDLGNLLDTTFGLWSRYLTMFVAIAAAVVVPVEVIVSGIGLSELSEGYQRTSSVGETFLPAGVSFFVTTPLITAMTVHAVTAVSRGSRPSARSAIQSGLDVFAPILLALLLYGLLVLAGVFLFVIPGIYWGVKGYFVAQAVVVDGKRGPDALTHSFRLTDGSWWRVLGTVIVFNLIIALPSGLIGLGFRALADAADAQAFVLLGTVLTSLFTLPLIAIATTLLFFDLRARKAGATPAGHLTPPAATTTPPDLEHPERPPGHGPPPPPPGLESERPEL